MTFAILQITHYGIGEEVESYINKKASITHTKRMSLDDCIQLISTNKNILKENVLNKMEMASSIERFYYVYDEELFPSLQFVDSVKVTRVGTENIRFLNRKKDNASSDFSF